MIAHKTKKNLHEVSCSQDQMLLMVGLLRQTQENNVPVVLHHIGQIEPLPINEVDKSRRVAVENSRFGRGIS